MNNKPVQPPSRLPAHELWVEISTRITSRDLHFRSGQEEAAVKSIVSIFNTTRDLMRANPDATEFLQVAAVLLETIRPYTARWHALQDETNRFRGPAERMQFREEMEQLQVDLRRFAPALTELLTSGHCTAIPELHAQGKPSLGREVRTGIQLRTGPVSCGATSARGPLTAEQAQAQINAAERLHIANRRGLPPNTSAEGLSNGRGLALSGGGIRSATFCLGVVQVLARAGLLTEFDYLSTVSGGGYLGSFLSNQSASAAAGKRRFNEIFTGATDSPQIRHLRNSSKYLLPTTTLQRLKLAGLLISGILATTLLAMAIPVFCALAIHLLARFGWLDGSRSISFAGRPWQPFWIAAAAAAVVAAACWLLRPITTVWRAFRNGLDTIAAYSSVLAGLCVTIAATPCLVGLWEKLQHWKLTSTSIVTLTTVVSGAAVLQAIRVAWKYRKALSRLFIVSGVVLFLIVYLATIQVLGITAMDPTAGFTAPERVVTWILAAWLLWAAFISLNLTGLHRYYRDRLSSCYLHTEPGDGEHGNAEPPKLEALSEHLPYHLINTTVNLTSSENPDLRGRGGDFFLLSKHFCGSTLMGYHPTELLSRMNPDLDLATAMAISGAAASTNMGWQTLHEYRTLMAIFNVRLGYWMRWNSGRSGWFAANAFVQLMREITGSLNEKSSTINVSDGGHIENLGAYELIRRRLKFIVCVDGGLDSAMDCADLNRLQRLVAIDFGYRIQFDTADLLLQSGYSTNYGLLVKIDYTPDVEPYEQKDLGWMLYIKLAMLGTEPSYLLDYRRQNQSFPHQTTLDQFFDEAQFEAYRKLGETAALNFLSTRFGTAQVTGFEEWFHQLAAYLLPDTDPAYVETGVRTVQGTDDEALCSS